MENDEGENSKTSFSIDVGDGENLRLIDISTADDYLIASPLFDSLEDLRLSVTLDSSNAHGNSNSVRSMEPGRPSYLRKSLAWDSSFFTDAGVLDTNELSLMNKGFKSRPNTQQQTGGTGDRHRLPQKPPKGPATIKGLLSKKNDYIVTDDKFARTKPVPNVMACKKFLSSVSPLANKTRSLSCSSPQKANSPAISSNLKRKSKLSASVSSSTTTSTSTTSSTAPWRYSGKSKPLTNLSLSTQYFPTSKAKSTDSKPNIDGISKSQSSLMRSGLQRPSPKIGFFDEDKSVLRKERAKFSEMGSTPPPGKNRFSGKITPVKLQKHGSSEPAKLKRSSLMTNRSIEISTVMEGENCYKSRKIGEGEHGRRNISLSSSLKMEERRFNGIPRYKVETTGKKEKGSIHKKSAEVKDLSNILELIDLNKDMMEIKKRSYNDENIFHNQGQDVSRSSTRPPLRDKTCMFNKGGFVAEKH